MIPGIKLLERIKELFKGKQIETVVYDSHENSYLGASPANMKKLQESIENIEKGNNLVEADLTLFA